MNAGSLHSSFRLMFIRWRDDCELWESFGKGYNSKLLGICFHKRVLFEVFFIQFSMLLVSEKKNSMTAT